MRSAGGSERPHRSGTLVFGDVFTSGNESHLRIPRSLRKKITEKQRQANLRFIFKTFETSLLLSRCPTK